MDTFLADDVDGARPYYYFFCALAELNNSWGSSKTWAAVALFGCAYSLFALIGSGVEVALWGGALMAAGCPSIFYCARAKPARSLSA